MLTQDGSEEARPRRAIVWTVVALLCAVVAAAQVHLNHRRQAAVDARQAAVARARAADDAAVRALQAVRQAWVIEHQGEDPTIDDAASLLNGGRPLAINNDGDAAYVDPATGGRARVWLLDQSRWIGVLSAKDDPARGIPAVSTPFVDAFGAVRRIVYAFSLVTWVALFLRFYAGAPTLPRHARTRAAGDLLGVALASTSLAMVGPGYWRAWNDFGDAEAAGFGVVAIGVSVVFLLLSRLERQPADRTPRCRACGYNLTGNTSGVCPECGTWMGRR